VANKA
jgi:hypothetical protein